MSARLSITEAESRCPDLVKGQVWTSVEDKYWFACFAGLNHPHYFQTYCHHQDRGDGCPICRHITTGNRMRSSTTAFIGKARVVHGDRFDYSQAAYEGVHTKLLIVCPKPGHGPFAQTPSNHLKGKGCPKCKAICTGNRLRFTWKELEATFSDLVPDQEREYTDNTTKLLFICEAGKGHPPYPQAVANHQQGRGCPKCCHSYGEIALEKAAIAVGITDYEEQKRFSDCRNPRTGRKLPFDGASESLKTLFEYHGGQHYRPVKRFGGIKAFRKLQRRDRIKKHWALRNGWQLIVVPYRITNIEAYLRKRINRFQKAA